MASLPASHSRLPHTLAKVAGEKNRVMTFASSQALSHQGESQRALAKRYKVKMTDYGKFVSAWQILVAEPNVHISVKSRKWVRAKAYLPQFLDIRRTFILKRER